MFARAQCAGREVWLPVMERPTRGAFRCSAVAMAAMLCLWGAPAASAQNDSSPPQSSVRGENFSAKPAPALFQSDCTGGGCHKGPQGLVKNHSQSGLASFLREHYTNSRESAAALSNYLLKLPAGPAQPEPRAARGTSPRGTPSPGDAPSWFGPEPAPGPNEARTPRQQQQPQQPGTRPPARAAARSGDDAAPAASTPPAPAAAAPAAAEPAKPQPTPRAQRGRQPPTAAVAAPPAPEAAPPPPPPAPPPPQFDIFD
jgi:hypothetical protein